MTLSPSFWKVSETKISDKVSHVTPLSELNEIYIEWDDVFRLFDG